jgi:hypothetical protein
MTATESHSFFYDYELRGLRVGDSAVVKALGGEYDKELIEQLRVPPAVPDDEHAPALLTQPPKDASRVLSNSVAVLHARSHSRGPYVSERHKQFGIARRRAAKHA